MAATAPLSAAIAAVRIGPRGAAEVLIVHPGGPFWAKKDEGAWSLPKGVLERDEEPLAAALREFAEETGFPAPPAPHVALGQIVQKSGKRVVAWAAHGDHDPAALRSNEIEIEWPPRTGRTLRIPEVDAAAYVDLEGAREKLNPAQLPLVERALSADTLSALGLG